MKSHWEIRKSVVDGWNVYAKYPDGFCMFAAHYKTERECKAFIAGKLKAQ